MRRTRVDREDNRASGKGQSTHAKLVLRSRERLDNSLGPKCAFAMWLESNPDR